MIAGDAEAVGGCQPGEIRYGLVGVKVLRTGQRRVENAIIAQPGQASVLGESFAM
jgi:hypothetical protein